MKPKYIGVILALFLAMGAYIIIAQGSTKNAASKPDKAAASYTPDWDSLRKYETPEWFRDAKLGIFIHWGPYSVPAYGSEWYPRNMYQDSVVWGGDGKVMQKEPSGIYKYHVEKHGQPGKFGYKDFIPMFKAEKFNPDEWVRIFQDAGAKYIVPVAEHHDSFAMYASKVTRWNAKDMGPKRDVLGELVKAGKKKGLKVGASSHLAFNWDYFNHKPEFDTSDPAYADLYGRAHVPYTPADSQFLEMWWARTKDIIDNYQPDILWFDFVLDRAEYRPYHPKLAAYYYNKGLEWGKEVVLQNKNFGGFESYPPGTNVLDLERGKMSDINAYPWQTDTSIGKNSWSHVTNWDSKTPNTIVDDLIDIVSKNGNLLLNVGPKADGTIPEDQKLVLKEIGNWLKTNGAAIYGTRPWVIFGEGPTEVATGHHTEGKNKELTSDDFRFTKKGDTVYAIAMDFSKDGSYKITSFGSKSKYLAGSKIKQVKMLGSSAKVDWKQTSEGLVIKTPDVPQGKYACAFSISM
ncbi:alpha-L-fucosidase [Pontibacter sp. E15-1]|uniref:alpha-L-fucosidase n=1 Tax=Pontibacter sp. E15-1 TaxID=2919918 RepID=UPI001F4FFD4C|nr:alpha-L-fucosidase [Pontibacter sp. E15-1]MCJ8163281.1 alpha-L-fucosidase [Pontibacter sp. E15-1]